MASDVISWHPRQTVYTSIIQIKDWFNLKHLFQSALQRQVQIMPFYIVSQKLKVLGRNCSTKGDLDDLKTLVEKEGRL
jgi:hypothetical protein